MGQGYEYVRVHNGPADFGLFDIFAALHGHEDLVVALETVADEDVAAGGIGVEAVDVGGLNVVQRVGTAADVEGVAVGQVGTATLILHQIRHHLGPVGPQEGDVARFTQMHLDGYVFAVHVNVAETGGHNETGELLQQIFPEAGAAEIRKVDFGLLRHIETSFPVLAFYSSRSTLMLLVPLRSNSERYVSMRSSRAP